MFLMAGVKVITLLLSLVLDTAKLVAPGHFDIMSSSTEVWIQI